MRTNFRRRACVILVATMVAAAAPLPAAASGSITSNCPDNYVCMWEDSNYSGSIYVEYERGSKDDDKVEIDWWDGDNEISSIKNNTDLYLIIFDDDDWNGATHCYNPNSHISSMGSWNDDAESFVLHVDCQI